MKAVKKARHEVRREAVPAVAEVPRPRLWPYLAGLAAALIAAFIVYSPELSGPFVFDDRYLPFMTPKFGLQPFLAWVAGVRPMLMLTYWANYQIGGIEPYGYKVVNLLLHLANGLLIALIVQKILEWAGVEQPMRRLLAVFGAALFLVHPVNTESVSYAASRSETLSVFFALAALAVFAYRRTPGTTWLRTIALIALIGVAVMTKEHTAAIPAVILLTDYFWNPGFSLEGAKRNWRFYACSVVLGIAGGAFIYFRVLRGAQTAGFGMKDLTVTDYFLTQCRAIWVYLRMLVLPYGQSIDHDFAISRSPLDHLAIVGMLALVGVTVAAWVYRKSYPLAAYGWFCFLILLAPTSSFLPIQDVLVERRLYLPFIGVVVICCEFLRRVRISRPALAGAMAAFLGVFAIATYNRNTIWANEIALWQDASEKAPKKSRPLFHLGYAYFQSATTGQPDYQSMMRVCSQSADTYAKAASVGKPEFTLLIDWAVSLSCAGREKEALETLDRASKMEQTGQLHAMYGMIYAKQFRYDEAMAELAKAEQLDPSFEMTYVYRGNIYLLRQEFAKAAEQFQKTLALNPDNQQALRGLQTANQNRRPVS